MPRTTATELVVQTLYGAATMIKETGQHPTVLREQVTSPGGTTAAALRELDDHKVRAAFITAMEAAANRSARARRWMTRRQGRGIDVVEVSGASWRTYRDLRLAALIDSPRAFASTYAREAAFDDDAWRARLSRTPGWLAFDGSRPVGTVTLWHDPDGEPPTRSTSWGCGSPPSPGAPVSPAG